MDILTSWSMGAKEGGVWMDVAYNSLSRKCRGLCICLPLAPVQPSPSEPFWRPQTLSLRPKVHPNSTQLTCLPSSPRAVVMGIQGINIPRTVLAPWTTGAVLGVDTSQKHSQGPQRPQVACRWNIPDKPSICVSSFPASLSPISYFWDSPLTITTHIQVLPAGCFWWPQMKISDIG